MLLVSVMLCSSKAVATYCRFNPAGPLCLLPGFDLHQTRVFWFS